MRPFHLAFPVADLTSTERFYVDCLGCKIGRTAERWIDFDLYGHQITAHLLPERAGSAGTNPVDGDQIHVPHFGVILNKDSWLALVNHLQECQQTFLLAPKIRFAGQVGEQGTFFIRDPSANVLEFKYFEDDALIFAK